MTSPASNSLLSPEQVAFYDDNGYLILRNRIPADLLARLRAAGDAWIADGINRDGDPDAPDLHFADRPSGRVMFRVDYLHDKGQPVSLELLGAPEMLGIAASLAGPNFVPTYESMVFKNTGDGAPIDWHQDAVHPRRWRIFNVDVYLDHSVSGGGALRVVPGSNKQRADICALEEASGWDVPGAIEVEMAPGDVLVHDVMLVHGSPPVEGNKLRRTIYYEFRAAEQIAAEGPWDAEWIARRMRLLPLALARHAAARPDAEQFDWQPDPAYRPGPGSDEATELRVVHTGHTPGAFCSAGSVDPMAMPAT
jgi:ectoine hydroxylase-related dioxygenase (phytanoyl-CoA dioxygenase family)